MTTGEVLIPHWSIEGSGKEPTVFADVEWTFPLEFVEAVWGDGEHVDRSVISATDQPPFGSRRFHIPFDAAVRNGCDSRFGIPLATGHSLNLCIWSRGSDNWDTSQEGCLDT